MESSHVQQRKDKKKVVDEVWTPERVRSFLELEPPAGVDADFHRLQRAYQSMRAEDFADFVKMFLAAGGRLDARGPDQQTLLEEISRHRHGGPFAEVLRAAGA
jgi:hypothetical protein